MTHIGRWNLVERTPADIEADVRAAAPPRTVAGLDITADATGLALFCDGAARGQAGVIPAVGLVFVADAASIVSRGLR
ncbi:hypothetical protein GCM10010313_37410 [Streptomyces violarus]|uniref:Uncharacterized protein n=1 Tax=Streptomyces violarus TaxID=67380 RepID=A0A7W4ZYZ7_9ACTN|nr:MULTISPECIES: hypothetical protein [Streptomyces]MBB3081217.1 hypothetical protein [Streptomyces violarus]WRU00324.1 hypothetical protein VJ737_22740 [Streptomyces sp. CGMCC 4.1772]GHD13039.1 hypothetical protein GCM10010313_37410 [Streptomyces violarus]